MSINSNNNLLNEILSTIDNLPTSKEEQEKSITIVENGTTEVAPDEGKTLSKVTVNVEIEQSGGGEDDFIGVKYSNFSGKQYNLPKTADARSLDKILQEPSEVAAVVNSAVNEHVLDLKFTNINTNANGGYFAQLEEVYLPTKASAFSQTFQNCAKLKTIHGNLSNIQTVGTSSFERCDSLDINAVIARMTNLKAIGNRSFTNCTQITELTLPATITSIHTGAFSGCTNLLNIYVPWAEGAIANAPWGATNATIHYNTTYDADGNPIVTEGE